MSKEAVCPMKLEPEPRTRLIQYQHRSQTYEARLNRKVEAARISMNPGLGHSDEEVEAEFAARRASTAQLA